MTFSSDEENDDAEVIAIKRAMRDARARKKSLTTLVKQRYEQDAQEKSEIELILRSTTSKLEDVKKKLSETEFDLREARYELQQLTSAHIKLKDEKKSIEQGYHVQLQEVKRQFEKESQQEVERLQLISMECDKVYKLIESFCHHQDRDHLQQQNHHNSGEKHISRTKRHLLDKALAVVSRIHTLSTTSTDNMESLHAAANKQYDDHLTELRKSHSRSHHDSAVDVAMMEMCRSLEEENVALMKEVKSLKEQVNRSEKDSSVSQLIPHYRTAIVRAKAYAANLEEQLERERKTSQALREQLEESYQDLKKVVEEKRKLYKRVKAHGLRAEAESYRETLQRDAAMAESRSERRSHDRDRPLSEERTKSREQIPTSRTSFAAPVSLQPVSNALSSSSTSQVKKSLSSQPQLEEKIKVELDGLDGQIDQLKERLKQAALLQSQKILSEVIDQSLSQLHQK